MKSAKEEVPLVSVIIPTYNHGEYISSAIKSVLCQSYNFFEIIIIDNFSEDGTKNIVESFNDGRIHYYRFKNKGVIAASRNFGVEKSEGEIIAFLDSDDEWEKGKLSSQVYHLNKEDIVCVASDYKAIGNTSNWRSHLKFNAKDSFKDYSYENIIIENPVVNSSAILYKTIFNKIGKLDESSDFIALEDWDLWIRISSQGQVRILKDSLVKYRIHASNTRDKRNVHFRSIKILEKQKKTNQINKKLFNRARGFRFLLLARAHLDMNDRKGIKYYIFAFWYVKGIKNILRSVIGILLFILPAYFRTPVVSFLFYISNFLKKNKIIPLAF